MVQPDWNELIYHSTWLLAPFAPIAFVGLEAGMVKAECLSQ